MDLSDSINDLIKSLRRSIGRDRDLRPLLDDVEETKAPSLAAAGCRKILEHIVYVTFEEKCTQNRGTRELNELINLLFKDDHLPIRLKGFISAVRESGNTGAHAQKGLKGSVSTVESVRLTTDDLRRVLDNLVPIVTWYVENVRPVDAEAEAEPSVTLKLALLYKRHAHPDEELLKALESALRERGHQVFIDRHMKIGVEWARELEHQLRQADAVIPLLSAASVQSDMLASEVQTVRDEADKRDGKPRLLPVRVRYDDKLPGEIAVLDRLQHFCWNDPRDTDRLVQELEAALAAPPEPLEPPEPLSLPVGALPLDSPCYVERASDAKLAQALARGESIVRIFGGRQMGKTSLLGRVLDQARKAGTRVVVADFQRMSSAELDSAERLFLTLARWIAKALNLDVSPQKVWDDSLPANDNFEHFLETYVLQNSNQRLVWAMDEVDRLFGRPFASDVFGLFRHWHNDRALHPDRPWKNLTLIFAYATEANLFITDMNQSPFNVGMELGLADFTMAEVETLNRRYGSPLTQAALTDFYEQLNGQPYLSSRGLFELRQGLDIAKFHERAEADDGFYGDHLRRLLVAVSRDEQLKLAIQDILRGRRGSSPEVFDRLRSAGIVRGDSPRDARLRCPLYEAYLGRHLL